MTDSAAGDRPDPAGAVDLAEFIDLLGRLRVWAGEPSYRTLARRAGPLLKPPQSLSHVTVAEAFRRDRRRLDQDLVVAIVRALGLDDSAVDRWRQACVRVHAEARTGGPVGAFRQLPADLPTFTGREAELMALLDAARGADDGPLTVVVSAIEGMAGVGKTQLAVRAAHELVRKGRFTDVQLFVNLRGFDSDRVPVDPALVLEAFLRQLGVPTQQIPETLDERAAMYRDRLHGKQALVLLDNAASGDQVRDLIPGSPGCLVLVTSRRSLVDLEHAVPHRLGLFSRAEAVALLSRIAGAERVAAEQAAAERIVEICGLLPLAVALAATRLRTRPAWSLAALADRLQAGVIDAPGGGSRKSVRSVFDLSYRGLSPAGRRAFCLLGLQPGTDVTAPAVAALVNGTVPEAEAVLEYLQDEHLVQEKTYGRYELHDLLRAHAASRAAVELSDEERAEAVHRYLTWSMLTMDAAGRALKPGRVIPEYHGVLTRAGVRGFNSPAKAAEWCEAELANLVAAADEAVRLGIPVLGWRLPMTVSTYLGVSANWRAWERLHLAGLESARRSGELAAQARMLSGLGMSAERLGRADEAERHLNEALTLWRELGDSRGEAGVLSNLVTIYSALDRPEQGLAAAERAVDLARRIGDPYVERTALQNSSSCLLVLNRPDQARERLMAAVELYRAPGDEFALGLVMGNIGFANLALGRYQDAEEAYREYLAISRRISNRYGQSEALRGIARVRRATSREAEARRLYEEALVILDDIGSPEAEKVRERLASPDLAHESDGRLTVY